MPQDADPLLGEARSFLLRTGQRGLRPGTCPGYSLRSAHLMGSHSPIGYRVAPKIRHSHIRAVTTMGSGASTDGFPCVQLPGGPVRRGRRSVPIAGCQKHGNPIGIGFNLQKSSRQRDIGGSLSTSGEAGETDGEPRTSCGRPAVPYAGTSSNDRTAAIPSATCLRRVCHLWRRSPS